MPTAIQAMTYQLRKIQKAQAECISEHGVIISHMKYEYQRLTRKERSYKEGIDYMKEQKEGASQK